MQKTLLEQKLREGACNGLNEAETATVHSNQLVYNKNSKSDNFKGSLLSHRIQTPVLADVSPQSRSMLNN